MDDKKYQAMLANVGRHCYVFPNIEVNDDPDIIDDDDLVGYAWRFFHEGPRKGIVKNVGIAIDGGIGYDVDIQNYNGVETEFSVPPSFVAFNYEQYAYQCREMRGVINRVLKAVKELKSRFRLTEGIADDGWLTKENKSSRVD